MNYVLSLALNLHHSNFTWQPLALILKECWVDDLYSPFPLSHLIKYICVISYLLTPVPFFFSLIVDTSLQKRFVQDEASHIHICICMQKFMFHLASQMLVPADSTFWTVGPLTHSEVNSMVCWMIRDLSCIL